LQAPKHQGQLISPPALSTPWLEQGLHLELLTVIMLWRRNWQQRDCLICMIFSVRVKRSHAFIGLLVLLHNADKSGTCSLHNWLAFKPPIYFAVFELKFDVEKRFRCRRLHYSWVFLCDV
jgi:hypothetical protein